MQTLVRPDEILCDTQTLTGNATPSEEQERDGKIGDGGPKPKPLQGGSDATEQAPGREKETGSEGDGP